MFRSFLLSGFLVAFIHPAFATQPGEDGSPCSVLYGGSEQTVAVPYAYYPYYICVAASTPVTPSTPVGQSDRCGNSAQCVDYYVPDVYNDYSGVGVPNEMPNPGISCSASSLSAVGQGGTSTLGCVGNSDYAGGVPAKYVCPAGSFGCDSSDGSYCSFSNGFYCGTDGSVLEPASPAYVSPHAGDDVADTAPAGWPSGASTASTSSSPAPDLSALNSSVDFSTTISVILSIAAVAIGIILALVAVRKVRGTVSVS